ncbi:MAG TPA: hypothetical protein VG457_05655, partial [Planctomycetota bacterium]|nr:hypothetical protein [Planctomycetota bacterium]
MSPDRQSELISRLFDAGALSPEEERELGLALRDSLETRRLLLSYFRLEGAILEQARAGLVSTPSPGRNFGTLRNFSAPRTPSLGAWISGLSAAAALLGLLFFLTDHRPASDPEGSVTRSSRPHHGGVSSMPDTLPEAPLPSDSVPESGRRPEAPELLPRDEPAPRRNEPDVSIPEPSAQKPSEPALGSEGSRPGDAVLTDVFLERVEGEVLLVGAGGRAVARAGDSVRAGQDLETGSGKSLAVLSFPD